MNQRVDFIPVQNVAINGERIKKYFNFLLYLLYRHYYKHISHFLYSKLPYNIFIGGGNEICLMQSEIRGP